jgi:hypothetical protein
VPQPPSDNPKPNATGAGLKEMIARMEAFGRARQVKFTWLAADCKFRVNVYDDSAWWRDLLKEAVLYQSTTSNSSLSSNREEQDDDLQEDDENDSREGIDAELEYDFCPSAIAVPNETETFETKELNSNSSSLDNISSGASFVPCGPIIPTLVASCDISIFLQRNCKDYLLQFRKTFHSTESLSDLVVPLLFYELKQCLFQSGSDSSYDYH